MNVNKTELAARINTSVLQRNTDRSQAEPQHEEASESVRVSLSAFGRAKSVSGKADKAIDESDLPGDVKLILKLIRDLKKKVAELLAELSRTMADATLNEDQRRMSVNSIQAELTTLQAALSDANAALLDALKAHGLSDAQITQALGLAQI